MSKHENLRYSESPPPSNRAARLEEEAGSKHKNALRVSTLTGLHGNGDYRTILVRHPCMHRENKGGNKSHEGRPRDLGLFFFPSRCITWDYGAALAFSMLAFVFFHPQQTKRALYFFFFFFYEFGL